MICVHSVCLEQAESISAEEASRDIHRGKPDITCVLDGHATLTDCHACQHVQYKLGEVAEEASP